MKHKHYELIIAFANGATIELKNGDKWDTARNPSWYDNLEYRIKPKEPKKVSMWQWVYKNSSGYKLTLGFYTTQEKAQDAYPGTNILRKLESSHILVEEE